jgi:hypothetical protein
MRLQNSAKMIVKRNFLLLVAAILILVYLKLSRNQSSPSAASDQGPDLVKQSIEKQIGDQDVLEKQAAEKQASDKETSPGKVAAIDPLEFYNMLKKSERQVFSQNKEDGVIELIFKLLNPIKITKGYFVEIGLVLEDESNTKLWRVNHNWTGLMIDDNLQNFAINLHKEIIEPSSIASLLESRKVPSKFQLLSLDTDYADYWILEAILTKFTPDVVVHEVNQQEPQMCVTVPKSTNLITWDGFSSFHGGSVCAFRCLAKRFKYTMVYCESTGNNCFWIRNDLLNFIGLDVPQLQAILTPEVLYKKLSFVYQGHSQTWHEVKCS